MDFELNIDSDFLNHLEEGVYVVDPERKILFWNRGAESITGFSKEEVIGSRCSDNLLVHVDDSGKCLCKNDCPIASTIEKDRIHQADVFLHHKEGFRLPVFVKTIPLKNQDGKITGAIEIFSDRSNRVDDLLDSQDNPRRKFIDPATGFFSKNHWLLKLKTVHTVWQESGANYGVVLIRFDNYFDIASKYGVQNGEKSLRVVCRTIRALSRETYMLGRWSEDAFAVVVPNISSKPLQLLTHRYKHVIESTGLKVNVDVFGMNVSTHCFVPQEGDGLDLIVAKIEEFFIPHQ